MYSPTFFADCDGNVAILTLFAPAKDLDVRLSFSGTLVPRNLALVLPLNKGRITQILWNSSFIKVNYVRY